MTKKEILPAILKYTTKIATSLSAVRDACPEADVSVQTELLLEVSALLSDSKVALSTLEDSIEKSSLKSCAKEQALAYKDHVVPAMDALRGFVDSLETLVDKDLWPMPTYGDLLFEI